MLTATTAGDGRRAVGKHRETFDITLTVTTPHGMRPERVKLELQARINEICAWGNTFPVGCSQVDLPETAADGGLRAMKIKVRRPTRG